MSNEGRPKRRVGCLIWLLAAVAGLVVLPVAIVAIVVILVVSGIWKLSFSLGQYPDGSGWDEVLRKANPRFEPQWSPDGAQIVFTFESGYRGVTHVAASDGSSVRRISDRDYSKVAFSPDISPDGSRIVYATTRHNVKGDSYGDNFEIETSGLDGSDRRRLTENGEQDVSPAWSPDGRRIAFFRDVTGHVRDDSDRGIYTVAPDGSDERLLLPFHLRDRPVSGPVWSPDGRLLAFVMAEPPDAAGLRRSVLYTVGADGMGLTRLFTSVASYHMNGILWTPAWSPDGQTLAFWVFLIDEVGDKLKLYTVSADGSRLREVLEHEPEYGGKASFSWSPDGTKLLFSSGYVRRRLLSDRYIYDPTVYVVNADGSDLRAFGEGTHASWSPDGSRIAMVNVYNNEDEATYLSTAALDGSDLRVVAIRDGRDRLEAVEGRCYWIICR